MNENIFVSVSDVVGTCGSLLMSEVPLRTTSLLASMMTSRMSLAGLADTARQNDLHAKDTKSF